MCTDWYRLIVGRKRGAKAQLLLLLYGTALTAMACRLLGVLVAYKLTGGMIVYAVARTVKRLKFVFEKLKHFIH